MLKTQDSHLFSFQYKTEIFAGHSVFPQVFKIKIIHFYFKEHYSMEENNINDIIEEIKNMPDSGGLKNDAPTQEFDMISPTASMMGTAAFAIRMQKSKRTKGNYAPMEVAFAWICLIMGYLFCRLFPVSEHTLGGFLFILLLFGTTAVVIKLRGAKFGKIPSLIACVSIVFSASLVVSSNDVIHNLSYIFALATYCYFIYSTTGNSVRSGMIAVDYLNAMFVLPVLSMGYAMDAIFSGATSKKGNGFMIKILAGMASTIIPTVIVAALLSYDEGFRTILSHMINFNLGEVLSHVISIIVGGIIGSYVFGLYISAVDNRISGAITADLCRRGIDKVRIVSPLSMFVSAVPRVFIYLVFFIAQWGYYISGFTGVLPDEFSYAEYAREGFFQLCTLAVFNLGSILITNLCMRRNGEKSSKMIKLLTVIYSTVTLVLISTAISKIIMYIDHYGLTQNRMYAACMMVVLAIIFVLFIAKQFVPKIPLGKISIAASVAIFMVLALCNVDGAVARYNVDRYIKGDFATVDMASMESLGDAAVPELVRLAEHMDKLNGTDISVAEVYDCDEDDIYGRLVRILNKKADEIADERYYREEGLGGMFSFNLPELKAERALERIGLLANPGADG